MILVPFKPDNLVREMVVDVPLSHENLGIYKVEKISAKEKITFIKDSPAKAGLWIGILERTLILLLCLINSISSIGFIIAMKALTRFKQFEDKTFAEYYLIGSMLSISLAIINGSLIRFIW